MQTGSMLGGWALIALIVAAFAALARPMGDWLYAIYARQDLRALRLFAPVERAMCQLGGIDPDREQTWRQYALAMLLFQIATAVATYALLRLQGSLPLNPRALAGMSPDLAFDTAISFVTNTNWQSYAGETTLSNLSQMLALVPHNFLSAASGIAVAFALFRGFARHETTQLGNFWADMVRITLYLLLPLSLVFAFVLVAGGVPQTFASSLDATTLEGAHQTLILGPVASQEAIKLIGTNGGGFFNANSAHPFENPTAWVNLLQVLSIFLIGVGLPLCFGRALGDRRQGWAILAAMLILFSAGVAVIYAAESAGNPLLHQAGVAGANLEGKEWRFGTVGSALYVAVTTAASCGAVNTMHNSLTPLGGLVALFNIELGEIVVGGVGSGIYGFLLFALLAVFIAGLMVGRTPEYVGKKIEGREVKLAVLAIVVLPLCILGDSALASVHPAGIAGIANKGPHGFSEILYAYTSATGNNGSAFAGLNANTAFWNGTLAVAMWIGRFFVMIPVLAIAGSLATKKHTPETAGSFPTTGPLWIGLLVGIILIVGGLTFLPALALGPIAEHLAMLSGTTF